VPKSKATHAQSVFQYLVDQGEMGPDDTLTPEPTAQGKCAPKTVMPWGFSFVKEMLAFSHSQRQMVTSCPSGFRL
jgi:hypothetical protein